MGGWRWVWRRLQVLFDKRSAEREMEDEIRFHLEREIETKVRSGMDPGEARRRALVAFGGVERTKEQVRDVRGARIVDDLVQDIRVAARSLPRQPVFALAVLLTLGIGIGGNVAMVGVMDAVFLRALPYEEPDRLVLGRVTWEGETGWTVSAPDYFDYRDQAASLTSLAALTPFDLEVTVTGRGDAERVRSPFVSPNLFPTLGVDPALGRHFVPEEGEVGPNVVILSHGYWERRFGGDPSVVGSALNIEGTPMTVVGVMPAGFRFLNDADLWLPMVRGGPYAGARQFHNWILVGRLAPGVDLAAARAEVDGISARLAAEYPDTNAGKGLDITPLDEALVERYRSTLTLLMGAVAVLLLVACANVAGLLLARGTARRPEMAVRSVMGAGRGRLARQLLTENTLVALVSALFGLALATWVQRGVLTLIPMDTLGRLDAGLSWRMVGAAVGVTAFTVLLFGILPAVRVARSDPARDLRGGTQRSGGSRAAARSRRALVVGQVALTAMLLVVTGLLLRSTAAVMGVDPGFRPEGLLVATVSPPRGKYADAGSRVRFYDELRRRLEMTPGVEAVALTSHLPIRDPGGNVRVAPPEAWGSAGVFGRLAFVRPVLPGFFEAMGIPRLEGRDVALTDDTTSAPVVVLSASLASALFPEGSALGRTVAMDQGGTEPATVEVVGVVGDVIPSSLSQGSEFAMYLPYPQRAPTALALAVRTSRDPGAMTPVLRDILRELDPEVPLARVGTMEAVLRDSVAGRRAVIVALGGFAAMALLLAAVGLYGVLAYQVSRRAHEIGVRMALGASVTTVSRTVLESGLGLVGLGLLLGLPASYYAGRFVQGMLFQVDRADPGTYLAVAAFLGGVATLACLIPARRAARVDPAVAFRSE